ncbi:transcriptional regulator [bacterium]|nr:transcriptional regulator [bacterium]
MLDAMSFWKQAGIDETRRVCELAGTSYEHFKHIAHKRRRPSVELANRLIKASNGQMSFEKLLFSKN